MRHSTAGDSKGNPSSSGHLSLPGLRGHIPELDGIRGIAILTVLLFHLFFYSMFRDNWGGRLARLAIWATQHGSHGVDLFFVLSGFLITGILLDARPLPGYFRNFYARRALRILPLYYAVLLVILVTYRHSGSYVLVSFFYLTNISPILGLTMVNGALWSLSVEEHFYLFWPMVVRRLPLRRVALVAGGICVTEPIIRGLAFPHISHTFLPAYTWFRLDGLATGALIACFVRSSRYSPRIAKITIGALILFGVLVQIVGAPWGIRQSETLFGAIGEFTAFNIICAAVVLWGASMSGLPQTRVLRTWPLRICGDLSYCLYIVHMMVMDLYDGALRTFHLPPATVTFYSMALRAAVVLALSFALAVVSRKFLEQPALRLKRFFDPRGVPVVKDARAAAGDRVAEVLAIDTDPA